MRWNVSDLQLPGSVEIKKGDNKPLKKSAGHKVSDLQYIWGTIKQSQHKATVVLFWKCHGCPLASTTARKCYFKTDFNSNWGQRVNEAANSGSQESYAIFDLPPLSPPTLCSLQRFCIVRGNLMLQISRACGTVKKKKKPGVRCLKPTCLPVPVCERVWVKRCLWSKLGTHEMIDRCNFPSRPIFVCRHFWLWWAQLNWTPPLLFWRRFSLYVHWIRAVQ